MERDNEKANEHKKEDMLARKIISLRRDKISLGSLLRTVSSKKYENLSDDLKEVQKLTNYIPELDEYIDFFKVKRDTSRKRNGSPRISV